MIQKTIEAVDMTDIMNTLGVVAIKRWVGGVRFSVELDDGRLGVGRTVGEAYGKAIQADAFNVRRAA